MMEDARQNTMRHNAPRPLLSGLLSLALSAGLLLSPAVGRAQVATDHPTLKGSNARTGSNLDPRNSNPGFLSIASNTAVSTSALRWFRTSGYTFDTAIDNTDDGDLNQIDEFGTVVGPFDPQPNGGVTRVPALATPNPLATRRTSNLSPAAGWAVVSNDVTNVPATEAEASFLYVPSRRTRNFTIGANSYAPNFAPRFAAYEFTETTPSALGSDPRKAANNALLRTFSWTLNSPNPTPRNLALYAWLPVGQTIFNGVSRIQQRYFVYEITYGTGQKFVDVVDTDAAGGGFVRLGGGGRPTSQVFPFAGLQPNGTPWPVTITLYNTIPRDANGNLTQSARDTNGLPRLVYADAARFSDRTAEMSATPTAAGFGGIGLDTRRVIAARNDNSLLALVTGNTITSRPVAVTRGSVTSHDYNTGVERWTYSPGDLLPENALFDETSAIFTPTGGFTPANRRDTPNPGDNANNAQTAYGDTYLKGTAITGTVTTTDRTAATEQVTIDPGTTALEPEKSYEITMYASGPDTASISNFVGSVQYEIFEGSVSAGIFTLNERDTRGFLRLGNRRYVHSAANRLRVVFYNTSSDVNDAGREIMVDAVRFNGAAGTAITSSPVHARAFIRQNLDPTAANNNVVPPVETNVVLIADERGRISCLDAQGRGDGTTKVYWTYPSTPTVNDTDTDGTPLYKDPNTNVGLGVNDGGNPFDGFNNTTQADLPAGFDLSTAAVVRQTIDVGGVPTQRDFLIVGGTNGRVYCISMEGRGDGTATAPGTTYRRWTYPDTYPSTQATVSRFGKITSVVTGDIAGTTRVYFGTELGRFFCVDALGSNNSQYGQAFRVTQRRWQFPAANALPLGAIEGAPTLDAANNRIFFGTLVNESVNASATSNLLSLNATTGAVIWNLVDTTLLSWRSGTAYVPASELTNVDLTPPAVGVVVPDTLFGMNENGSVYAFNADTGATIWRDAELQSGGRGSLGYTRMIAQDRTFATGIFPTITVPTEGGRFAALFARLGNETSFSPPIAGVPNATGNRLAWGARVDTPVVASITTLGDPTGLDAFLYGASSDGTLFAFSGNAAGGGGGIVGPIPIVEDVPDNNNDPAFVGFRNAEVALLSRTGFIRLRQTQTGTTRGNYNYADVINTGGPITDPANPFGRVKAPFKSTKLVPPAGQNIGYEWGETIYLVVYNFPAPATDADGNAISPPIIDVTVTTEGRGSRPITSEARIFKDKSETDGDGGYAVIQVPLTSGGNTSLTPGPGLISVAIRTSAGNRNFVQQAISLRPGQSRINYTVANPLAIAMLPRYSDGIRTPDVDVNGNPVLNAYQIGATNVASSKDNVNGSPQITNGIPATGRDSSKLGQTFGNVQNGQSARTGIMVYDRSLMTLLRGEGRGLDNVRVDRRDLDWQGGKDAVIKQFQKTYGALFGKFEDLPTETPNVSLDYPNIQRERVTATKDPNGSPENPLFSGVSLDGPRGPGGALVTDGANGGTDNTGTRILRPTPLEFKLDTPKYQPPSFVNDLGLAGGVVSDSAGNTPLQGYGGRYSVYVDSDGNGLFVPGREAYRSFNLFTRVAPDERLVVTTPTVDLGALSGGAGYDVSLGYDSSLPKYRTMSYGGAVSPWGGNYTRLFQPFTVLNEGNVNLLNVRVAKGTRDDTTGSKVVFPWQTFSILNDDSSAWLDASLDVWSDLDLNFAPVWDTTNGLNRVIGQKPRVTDLTGRSVQANPVSRFNANVPNSGTPLLNGVVSRDPRIGVTIPIGFPMGPYSQTFRVIEDFGLGGATENDELLSIGYQNRNVDPLESYSDPGVRVNFSVVETQLTGGASGLAPKMVDLGSLNDATTGQVSGFSSRQPAAARALNGAVAMVFSSDRQDAGVPAWEPATGKTAGGNLPYRLWISTLAGNGPGAKRNGYSPDSQTRDLNQFQPSGANGAWWRQEVGAYPTGTSATLFPPLDGASGAATDASMSFGLPALPVAGFANPAANGDPTVASFTGVTLAFVGNVNRAGAAGTLVDSRIFAARLALAADGTATLADPTPMPYDPTSRKGKPSVVESFAGNTQGATIVYPVVSGNASSLFITRFQGGTFKEPIPIDLGTAFESAGEPSATIRTRQDGIQVLEIAFAGRLRGRSGNEIFQMALILDPATGLPYVPFRYIAYQVRGERMTYDATSGSYRVRGAYLREPFIDAADPTQNYDEQVYLRSNGVPVDLRDPVTRKTDRESRVESSSSRVLGGQIYFDRGAGSVRSVGGVLPRSAEVLLDYDAYVIRLSGNDGNGYGSPTLMKDTRRAPSNSAGTYDAYWFQGNGVANLSTASPDTSPNTYTDRTYALFTRAAQAGGQTVRPFLTTTRLGIRLPRPLLTNADGSFAETITVTGANGPYQIDPAGGKVYFTRFDENNAVSVAASGSGTISGFTLTQAAIGIVGERAEEPLPLGRAINENNVTAFFDPVFNLPGEKFDRRGLIWTFWSSTRNGAPNIFMGTISPKLVPFVPAQ